MGRESRLNKKLTRKQTVFVKHVLNGESLTDAVVQSYEVKDRKVATSIGSENLRKLDIREAIDEGLRAHGLSSSVVTANIGAIANHKPEKISADTVLKANIELLKLQGAYIDDKVQHNYSMYEHIETMTLKEIEAELDNIHTQTNELMTEIATQ